MCSGRFMKASVELMWVREHWLKKPFGKAFTGPPWLGTRLAMFGSAKNAKGMVMWLGHLQRN
jgi:hypothetical protein